MNIINCKSIAQKWKDEIKAMNIPARLCVIQAGDDPASNAYIRGKIKDCNEVGFQCTHIKINSDYREQVLEEIKDALVEVTFDKSIHGVIVQMPLPFGIKFEEFEQYIPSLKDVDGFVARSPFEPCTPSGIMRLLDEYGINPAGKKCVIIGRSDIVGKPLARMMTRADATVTLCHSKTPQETLKNELRTADVVVSAAGQCGVISTKECKKNSVIIDVGINRMEERLCGDVNVYSDDDVNITPVPGGVGLLTRAMLLDNVARAYRLSRPTLTRREEHY